jgi:hypothetical protein
MNRDIMHKLGFDKEMDLIDKKICPLCKKPVGVFRDALSRKEYGISGICQECQDGVFGK